MKITEEMLLESKSVREKLKDKTEALDKVKELIFLPNTELMTSIQVAEFYEVGYQAINSLTKDHREELATDGNEVIEGERLKSLKNLSQLKTRAKYLSIFPRRAILRVGMLLRDSKIAKQVRDYLLDVEEESTHRKFMQFCDDFGFDIIPIPSTITYYYPAKQLLIALGYAGNTTQMLRDYFNPKEKKKFNYIWYISETGLRRLCTGQKREKMVGVLAKYLGIESFSSPVEADVAYAIKEAFKDYTITTQKQIPISDDRIDLYIEELKIAIEVDEDGHSSYNDEEEKQRQEMFEDYLDCTFIRANPHQFGYTVGQTIYEIRQIERKKIVETKIKATLI